MERWRKAHPRADHEAPLALVSEGPRGTLIDATNGAARTAGVRAGQKLTDARAICPPLATHPADPQGDADALHRLALWTQRWAPWSATDGEDGLLLDTSGAAHLFGGEDAMIAEMRARFEGLGLTARIALAPTIGAAWALARFAESPAPCAPGDLAARLAPLPVEALRLDSDTVLLLRRLGLKTIGALAALPRLSLARRFRKAEGPAANPLIRLDQALGRSEETVAPTERRDIPCARRRVAEPVLHTSILAPILAALAEELCARLETRQLGLRRVRFDAFRVDGHVARIEAETATGTRDPGHILRLLDEKLETLDAGFGFDAFALVALADEPLENRQPGLAEEAREGIPLAQLIDRLCARIGASHVRRPKPCASHIPERAIVWRPALADDATGAEEQSVPLHRRPLRLLDRPEPIAVVYATPEGPPKRFRWRGALHDVARLEGPERIAPEWWRERSNARLRDYYRIEDEAGRRFWIYRHGLADDGRGGSPGWFLHGLFG